MIAETKGRGHSLHLRSNHLDLVEMRRRRAAPDELIRHLHTRLIEYLTSGKMPHRYIVEIAICSE
jgi:hypothetical protein